MNEQQAVTISDIARASGFGRSTVSLALRNHPSIALTTRRKVQEVAARLGYRTNPFIAAYQSNVRRNRRQPSGAVLAWLHFDSRKIGAAGGGTASMARLFDSARLRAEAQGFRLEFFDPMDSGISAGRLAQILAARGINGMIVSSSNRPEPELNRFTKTFPWDSFASVSIRHDLRELRSHHVACDYYHDTRRIIGELTSRNYRRIGHINNRYAVALTRNATSAAFLHYQSQIPARERVPQAVFDEREWTEERFLSWYRKNRPDAVFGILTEDNERLWAWLDANGIDVPSKLGVATITGNKPDRLKSTQLRVSGCYVQVETIGATAVDLLVDSLQRNLIGVPSICQSVLIESRWIEGSTLRGSH